MLADVSCDGIAKTELLGSTPEVSQSGVTSSGAESSGLGTF
jgi:hypothetical protein